jgi:signal transduction histidine kinase/DNA-binding response OmpR family regulator
MSTPLLTVSVRYEHDVVAARQRARVVAAALGFDAVGQTRIATAVSEIARNAFAYAGGGRVDYAVEGATAPQLLVVTIADRGPGIRDLDRVLAGRYTSSTGMGLGIIGARRLMDRCLVESSAGGTTVTLTKILPRQTLVSPEELRQLATDLLIRRPGSALEEAQQQNHELLRTLDDLRARQEELERVNRELEDTNRGVVALYAELDERADHLRRADELKTRFLSNMTHEFRTPVNSILALVDLLAERLQTPLDRKDEIFYIRKSAQQLSEIVNDLLDLAKAEAGKVEIRPAPFEVPALFGALRGMLRPLLVNHQSLALVFDEPEGLPPLVSDESKLSQILRNLISNALKYTEAGEVRVTAQLTSDRQQVEFRVADTGIGIPDAEIGRIFDEFVQIENPLQRRTKGTGLGLPLSRRLAELLGGAIAVQSTLGAGSVFTVTIPIAYRRVGHEPLPDLRSDCTPVLVVEDSDEDQMLYARVLEGGRYQAVAVRSTAGAAAALQAFRPAAIVLDIRLHGQDAWDLLARIKRDPATTSIPVIVVSTIDDRQKGFALGADAYAVKPIDRDWLLAKLDALSGESAPRILVIDDEEASRFILRGLLADGRHEIVEAPSGADGLRLARDTSPDVILLDLHLDDTTGYAVSQSLRQDPATAAIPLVVVTAQHLSADDRLQLGERTPVVSKAGLTRESLRAAIRQASRPALEQPHTHGRAPYRG